MGKGGSPSKTTTVQKADPWKEAQPYLLDVMNWASDMYGGGDAPYMAANMATLPSWMTGPLASSLQSGIGGVNDWSSLATNAFMPLLFPNSPSYLGVNELSGAPSVGGISGIPGVGQLGNISGINAINPAAIGGVGQIGNAPSAAGYGINEMPAVWNTLYGGVDNPYVQGMANDISNRTQQAWNDQARTVQDTLMEQILPGIESQFNTAGQLGQSRQALLEGQAISDAQTTLGKYSRDLGTSLAGQLSNLYGGLYENAEGRSANLASQLAAQSGQTGQFNAGMLMQALLANQGAQGQNAGLTLQALLANQGAEGQNANLALNLGQTNLGAQQYNSNLALQQALANQQAGKYNADYLMQAALANMQAQQTNQGADLEAQKLGLQGNMMSQNALGMLPSIAGLPTSLLSSYMSAYSPLLSQEQGLMDLAVQNYYAQQAAPWDYLANYAQNFIFPAAGMGGTSTTKSPIYSNPLSSALGGFMGGSALAEGLGSMTTGFAAAPFMAALPWMGLLYGLFQ